MLALALSDSDLDRLVDRLVPRLVAAMTPAPAHPEWADKDSKGFV